MAGDWIKLRKCLYTHPKVIRMASATGLCEEVIVGWLGKVWCWADDATANGNVDSVTLGDVSRVTGAPTKLLAAMQSVGWMCQTSEGICFPDYEKHMSNNAKTRAKTQKRVKRSRNARSVTKALPEKRREEKRREALADHDSELADHSDISVSVEAAERLRTVTGKLGEPSDARTRKFLADACKASITDFSENWLMDSVQGVLETQPRNRWAYLRRCLQNKATDAGKIFK